MIPKIPFYLMIALLFCTIQTKAQVLMDYVKIQKPDYCLKDSLDSKSIIGRPVKIWHNGGVYSTLNEGNTYKFPSKEIKAKSGRNAWGKYEPKAGDTGTVVHILYDTKNKNNNIYLIKVGDNYVPLGCYYLTDVNQLDVFEQDNLRVIQDSLKNVNYANGCKFKRREVNESWSRAGLTNIDKVSEIFACDLTTKGIDTVMLCKYLFDNGSLPIEKAFVLWLDNGNGFVKAFFNNSKHQPTENKTIPFHSALLINHFFSNRLDTVTSEPKSELWISHSLGYSIQVYTKNSFFRERLTDVIIRQDKTHPKSVWWILISEQLATFKEE